MLTKSHTDTVKAHSSDSQTQRFKDQCGDIEGALEGVQCDLHFTVTHSALPMRYGTHVELLRYAA
jgi:hypothetical protein